MEALKMRAWRRSGVWGLGALTCLASFGCEAQVGPDYTGEVLLELRGHVVAPLDRSNDLVPALAFMVSGKPGKDPFRAPLSVVFVDGKLEGVFPSDFKLSVAGPPPMGAGADMAIGVVVLVPRHHPTSFELPTDSLGVLTGISSTDDSSFTEHRRGCTYSGRCVERDYSCTTQPCEVIDSVGEPDQPEASVRFGDKACAGGVCYQQISSCNDEQSCFRQVVRCDVSAPGAQTYGDREVAICEKTAETGDASVLKLEQYALIVSDAFVIYSEVDHPAGASLLGLEGLKHGYHVVKNNAAESDQSFIDYARCRFDARVEALAQINEANGTHYVYSDSELDQTAVLTRFSQLAAERCPAALLLEDAADVPVDLNLASALPTP